MTPDTTKLDPVTAFASERRNGFAAFLLLVAVLLAGASIYGIVTGFPLLRGESAKSDEAKKQTEDAAKKPERINHGEYISLGIFAGIATLSIGGYGLALLVATPKTSIEERRLEARTAILFSGVALGVCMMLFGATLFALRLDALHDWLTLGKSRQMMPVVTSIVVAVIGALFAFLAIAPARAEERNNQKLRRFVYGTNAVLMTLILVGCLFGLNALIAVKFPGKLDTTENGFFTLDPKTKQYLLDLDQNITIYSTLPSAIDGDSADVDPALVRSIPDARRLLEEFVAVNPLRITVRTLSRVTDQKEITALASRYPSQPILRDVGLLLVRGSDETRAAFISLSDLTKPTGRNSWTFEGEGRLIRDLLFLADNKTKTIIYVTQGSGELSLAPPRRRDDRTMQLIKQKLEQINCEIRPLVFDGKTTKVPDDANIVVVADPQAPLPKEGLEALKLYSNPPPPPPNAPPALAPKKGKLIILAGAVPAPDNKTLMTTGVEELLAPFGVTLGTEQVYGDPLQDIRSPAIVTMTVDASSSLPFVRDFSGQTFYLPFSRMVNSAPPMPQSTVRVETILQTREGHRTYLDGPNIQDATRNYIELQKNPALREAKKYSSDPRPIGIAVREGETTRIIAIGCGILFADFFMQQSRAETPIELFAGMVDTLRDRPAVASLATKQYGTYIPPAESQFNQYFWLPVTVVPLLFAAAGVGVWIVRRK
ncbi:MAG: Gldg family protein [Gemmataceae bacterium]